MSPSLAELVNPLQGTDSDFHFSRGNTLPLAALPWGMTHWSAQTDEGRWLFSPRAPKLQGVRATHQPSPWIADYGYVTLMPQTGPRALGAVERASFYKIDAATFRPHRFRAHLARYRTDMELAPTERGAILRLTFPEGAPARLILEPGEGRAGVEIFPERGLVVGWTGSNSGGAPDGFACHYVVQLDRPFGEWGAFGGGRVFERARQQAGERVGAYVELDVTGARVVTARVATSFIGAEQALVTLERELGERGFEEVAAAGQAAWDALLGRVQVEGASAAQRRTFYSCLYRALLFPRAFHEQDTSGRTVHFSPYDGTVHGGVLYTDNGFWDTFRTVYPLLALVYPERLGEIVEGWVQAAREGGWFPKWASPGYRDCMIGTHLDVVVADAYLRGVRGFDAEAAYAAARRDATEQGDPQGRWGRRALADYLALGFVPAEGDDAKAAARTQEYAYTDYCVGRLAAALGEDEDAEVFLRRSLSYRNVFDPAVGFMRARTRGGAWLEPFDPFAWDTRAYVEGGAWQYSWAAPHDPAGLIALHGGRAAFAAKLDRMLETPPHFGVGTYPYEIHEMTEMAATDFGQYAHSNQPVHHVLYLYACAGQPWKMQRAVRRVLDELYTPDDLPGDEDNGEMGAWYVLSALGVFPLCPGDPSFVLGSPLFERAVVRRPAGDLEIVAEGSGPGRPYVHRVMLDGAPHPATWVGHERVAGAARLRFTMGDSPKEEEVPPGDLLPPSLTPYT